MDVTSSWAKPLRPLPLFTALYCGAHVALFAVCGALGWGPGARAREAVNRFLGAVNAAYLTVFLVPVVLEDGQGWLHMNFAGANTPSHEHLLQVTFGWMVADFAYEASKVLVDGAKWDFTMFAHHAVTMLMCVTGLESGGSGRVLALVGLMSEITTPFLNAKLFIKLAGWEDTTLALVNNAIFSLTFLVARLGWGTPMLVNSAMSDAVPLHVKLGGLGMYVINLMWSVFILRKMAETLGLRGPSPRKTK